MNNTEIYDVAIIGGGPAGLNAALVLARARRKVVVIDEGRPRNRVTQESHGFLTRDGIKPEEFRKMAREEVARYESVSFVGGKVADVAGEDGQFEITLADSPSPLMSQKLLLAGGLKDVMGDLDVSGLTEVYGRSAFVCPFCDGWELRDKALAVIMVHEAGLHLVKMLTGWSKDITCFTHGKVKLTNEEKQDLQKHGIRTLEERIKQIHSHEGQVDQIELTSGEIVSCEGIFFTPSIVQGFSLPEAMGCEVEPFGITERIVVDGMGRTSVPGIYAAGDAAGVQNQLIAAAASGAAIGAAIQADFVLKEWEVRSAAY